MIHNKWHGLFGQAITAELRKIPKMITKEMTTASLPFYWKNPYRDLSCLQRLIRRLASILLSFRDSCRFLRVCFLYRPTRVIFAKGESIAPWALFACRLLSKSRLISWWPDDPRLTKNRNIAHYWRRFDKIFVYDRGLVQDLSSSFPGSYFTYLPLAGDATVFCSQNPAGLEGRDRKIVFIGIANNKRKEFFREFACEDLHLIGPGWAGTSYGRVIADSISPKESVGIYTKYLASVNIHDQQTISSPNTRFFELMLLGIVQFVEPIPDILEILGPDYPFYFSNPQDLLQKWKRLKEIDQLEYSYIAHKLEALKKRFIADHTFKSRIKSLLEESD